MKKCIVIAAALTGAILTACAPNAQPEESASESMEAAESADQAEPTGGSSEAEADNEAEKNGSEETGAEGTGEVGTGLKETNSHGENDGETTISERKILHPIIMEQRFSDYSEYGEYGEGYQSFCSGTVSTVEIREEDYPELQKALSDFSEAKREAVEQEFHTLSEIAREEFSIWQEQPDCVTFYPYSTESVITVLRADDQVFSFVNESYVFSGGAHGNGGVAGYNYDSQTGKLLTLSDVLSDREGLYEEIIARLSEEYGEDGLFPEYQETVRQEVYEEPSGLGDYDHRLNFTLTSQGMTVYFNPYEIGPWAAGTIKVEIPYENEKPGFYQQYGCSTDAGVHKLKEYEILHVDIDGDGTLEEVSYAPTDADEFMTVYTVTANGAEVTLDGHYGITAAYLFQGEDGVYFYGECLSDNDYRYLSIVDLASLAGGDPKTSTFHSGFYGSVPMDSGDFELSDRGDLLSSGLITRTYRIGAEGQPVPLEEEYQTGGWSLTAIADIPAWTGADFHEKTMIPAGTKLFWTATDNQTYGILEDAADGTQYKVLVDGSGWPRTIEGTSIEEYFDGLMFAG